MNDEARPFDGHAGRVMIAVEGLSARRPPLALARIGFSLDAGVHAVLAGRERVRAGVARVLERRAGDPTTARSIAYVPMAPPLPDALTVRDTLLAAASIRGDDATSPEERLAALGLESLAGRRVRTLAPEEARAVALTEALTSTVATVILIDEPFVGVDARTTALLGDHLRARARKGACILVATASPNDATTLAKSVLVLSRGALVRHAPSPRAVADLAERPTRLRVVASDPRALLAELAREAAATDLESRDGALFVRGDDPTELAAAIGRAVVRAGVDLLEMRTELPPVEELAASATLAAAAAYQKAFSRDRAKAPPTPPRGSGAT